jgi:hypothetical protein
MELSKCGASSKSKLGAYAICPMLEDGSTVYGTFVPVRFVITGPDLNQ